MRVTNITAAWLACAAIGATLALPALAQEPAGDSAAVEEAASTDASPAQAAGPEFEFQTGDIVLPNKVATLHLGESYRYLSPEHTERMLVYWGNPPGFNTQGAIVPTNVDLASADGWAVILTYLDEGHVDDSDASDIDYDDLLDDMKEGMESQNAERRKGGYQPIHLVGWAEKPRYDAATKKLYWAKEIAGDGSSAHGLNYDVRVLGREGVLSMNAVAGMHQLSDIRSAMQPLIQLAEFNEGYRYAEFNKKTDRMAEYGLGALIAVGAAAKFGLFAKLWVFILAAKKFIIAGVIGLGALISRLLGKKKDEAA